MILRCAVVDDHPVFREGLARMLDALPDVQVVASGGSASDALDIAEADRPDVMLLDLRLPDRSGLEVLPDLLRASPGTYIILLTGFAEEDLIIEAFKAGARGVLFKESDIDRIADEIRTVAAGGVRLDTHLGARLVGELHRLTMESTPALTARESQILTLLTRGLSNCEIAAALGIQENTVKSHLSRLFEKVGVTDRLQAALYAIRLGLNEKASSGNG